MAVVTVRQLLDSGVHFGHLDLEDLLNRVANLDLVGPAVDDQGVLVQGFADLGLFLQPRAGAQAGEADRAAAADFAIVRLQVTICLIMLHYLPITVV